MLYRNVKTGALVKTPCKITGKNWALVEETSADTDLEDFEEESVQEGVEEETSADTVDEETAQEDPEEEITEEAPAEKPKRTRRGSK